jgi:CRISPR-associated protein Cas2
MDLLVTYDIATLDRVGERRLARVAKVCEGFGVRAQYSVFECRVTNTGRQLLIDKLREVIDHELDQVNVYSVPRDLGDIRVTLGRRAAYVIGGSWIV